MRFGVRIEGLNDHQRASGAKIDSPENQRQPSEVKAVTVQVTPEQAEKLVLAANEGKLQVVMRNYGEQ
jgi:Flp pilus assembly protein CpaB